MTTIQLGPAVTTVASVANEFLALSEQDGGAVPPVDQMKLQKLLFYAHAWYLGGNNQPLFEDDFEAWPWGPVVRAVYSQTVKFGRSPVTGRIVEIQNSGFVAPEGVKTPELKAFVKEVWDIHKSYTGIQLSNSTHAQGEPWTILKEHYESLEDKPTIPNPLIASVYKAKLVNENSTAE